MSNFFYRCTLSSVIMTYTYARQVYENMDIDVIGCDIVYLDEHICEKSGFSIDVEEYFLNKKVVFMVFPVLSDNSNISKNGNLTLEFYQYILNKCLVFICEAKINALVN